MRFWPGFAAAVLCLVGSARARAGAPGVSSLRHDTRIDITVTSMGATWFIASELLKAELVPQKCRWCYRAADGGDLLNPYDGAVRRRLLWKSARTADVVSSALAFAIEPASAVGLTAFAANKDDALSGVPLDALLMAEATVVAGVINQIVKFGFARERPFVHYLPRVPNAVRELADSPSDDNLSFYSGHTTLAFVVATSSGTIAIMRGYRLAPLVLGAGLAMAGTVGYLRIAADKHYFSDVITAAVIGSLVGVGVPLFWHSPSSEQTSPAGASMQPLGSPPARTVLSLSGHF